MKRVYCCASGRRSIGHSLAEGAADGAVWHGRSSPAHVSKSGVGIGLVLPKKSGQMEGEVSDNQTTAPFLPCRVAGLAAFTREMAQPGSSLESGESHAPRAVGSKTVRATRPAVPPRAEYGPAREGTLIPAAH